MKNDYTEDYTVGKLLGLPIFLVNRVYERLTRNSTIKIAYRFKFDNGFGASVVQFADKSFSGGHNYELGVLKISDYDDYSLTYSTDITTDVERGDEHYINELLHDIERLDANGRKIKLIES